MPNLLLPYLIFKILLVLWLSVYLTLLVLDDTLVLDYGPDIYPLRLLVEKERNVRKDSDLFPVILFIVCLEFIGECQLSITYNFWGEPVSKYFLTDSEKK